MTAEKEHVDQDYDYYDETLDDEDDGARGPIRMVVLFIVLAAFVGVGWIAFKQGVREGASKVPILKADSSSTKETPPGAPAQPGSTEVYGRPSQNTGEPEQLLPPPEQPIGPSVKPAPAPSASAPAPAAPAPQAAAPAAAPPVVADTPPAAAAPQATPAVASGAYLVQVVAASSNAEANQHWTKLSGKYTDLLGPYQPDIAAAELPGKGTVHRLRFGPFAGRDDATRVCDALKGRGQGCFVVKK